MEENELTYLVENQVAYMTINREANRNSVTMQVIHLFLEHLDVAEKDETVRTVCITGAGEKAFCSGADLGGALAGDEAAKQSAFAGYAQLLKRIAGFPKPTVARINGHCLAGGTGFMLACDIAVARDDAKFGTPEVNLGLFPMMIGALVFRNVLRKKAMKMILLGEKLTAQEALDMGLLTAIVPAQSLDVEVNGILEALTAKSPIGMKIGKEAFSAAQDMALDQALDFLAPKLGEVAATRDAAEGITAFIEKRAPVFTGQ